MTKADGYMEQNISKYKAFVTAVTVGSFFEVAKILNYSQSGISTMIADLHRKEVDKFQLCEEINKAIE